MLVQAIMSGLGDSVNPCNFTTLLIFVMILSHVGYQEKQIYWYGSLFVGLAGTMQFISVLGFLDPFMMSDIIMQVIRVIYLMLASSFLVLGIVHVLDWYSLKKHGNVERFKLTVPVFLKNSDGGQQVNRVRKTLVLILNICIVAISAVLMSFISAAYPQNEFVFVLHSHLMAGGGKGGVHQAFGLYSFMTVLPLIVVWVLVRVTAMHGKENTRVISYYKGLSAVLLGATGFGLGHFFLN